MTGYAQKRGGQGRVELGDGYWVEVKPLNLIGVQEVRRLLYGDIEAKEGVQQIRISQMDVANAMRRALVEGIKGWNLDDFEGAKLFVTFETVADLAVDDQRAILKKILGSITEFNAVFGLNETATVVTGVATPPTVPEAPPLDSEAFPEGSPPTSPAILTA
jgi:hypothetical protein